MNIINKLFKSKEFVPPWINYPQQTLSAKQIKRFEQIALKPNQRIYDPDYFLKKDNSFTICVDLDDTLTLFNKEIQEIYLRQYFYRALCAINKIKGVRLVLWTASLQPSAMDKFLRFPELLDLFDEVIFGNNFSTNQKIISKEVIDQETNELKQFIKQYAMRDDVDKQLLEKLKKSLDFRKTYVNAKNLNLLNYQLLIDNSLAEEISSEWMDYDLLRLPTYDLSTKNDSNEFDLIRLESMILRLPLLVQALVQADPDKRQIYLDNYEQALNTIYHQYLDQDRHAILNFISETIIDQQLSPLPIHKAIVQNDKFLTFSAVTQKHNTKKEQIIFFKARARVAMKRSSGQELNFGSFQKEINFLASNRQEFLARYITTGKKNKVVYYTYEYIPVPKFGDTWLINPHGKPSPKTAEIIVQHLSTLQSLELDSKVEKTLKTFDALKAKRAWDIQDRVTKKMINHILSPDQLRQARQISLDYYSGLKAKDYVLTHGDFHPANILVQNGQVYLIDWEMLQKNNQTFDLALLWLRSWNRPQWRQILFDSFFNKRDKKLIDLFYANILFLAPAEIVYWVEVINEPWRHHHHLAKQAINAHLQAFLEALAYFERLQIDR